MTVLLGTQAVGQTAGREIDIGVVEYRVLFDVSLEPAAFHEPLRQISRLPHFFGINSLPIGHVHATVIQRLTSPEILLSDRTELDNWSGKMGRYIFEVVQRDVRR
jgi:hypothetical protein